MAGDEEVRMDEYETQIMFGIYDSGQGDFVSAEMEFVSLKVVQKTSFYANTTVPFAQQLNTTQCDT